MSYKPKLIKEIPNAAEACKTISSAADNIKATSSGIADIIGTFGSFMNPRNYGADNEVSTQIRNNYNIDLSTEDVKKIRNSCENVTSNVQSNSIDFSKCKYCETNMCTVKNVTQRNAAKSTSDCQINSLIDTLMKKEFTVDSMAVIKAVQDAKGAVSNNSANTNICTNVNQDMSTTQYFENVSNCANKTIGKQTNALSTCGDLMDVIQENTIDGFSKCMNNATNTASTYITSEIKLKTEADNKQTADSTISPMMIFGSILCSCIVLIILSAAAYFLM
jgi:hypothetical protein